MTILNSHRLTMGDVLLHNATTSTPKRISAYLNLLPERYQNLSFDQLNKEVRMANALLASAGKMKRFRTAEIKGYQFKVTELGRQYYKEKGLAKFFD